VVAAALRCRHESRAGAAAGRDPAGLGPRPALQRLQRRHELQRLLASANPGPLPPLQAGSLPERKPQINEAIALNTTRLSVSLQDQHTAILRSTLPGTLGVFFGSAIVSAFLFMLKRQI
jgi:hypothetical protein